MELKTENSTNNSTKNPNLGFIGLARKDWNLDTWKFRKIKKWVWERLGKKKEGNWIRIVSSWIFWTVLTFWNGDIRGWMWFGVSCLCSLCCHVLCPGLAAKLTPDSTFPQFCLSWSHPKKKINKKINNKQKQKYKLKFDQNSFH